MADFAEWGVKEAEKALEARTDEHGDRARAFYNGDHWQGGEGWIGPRAEGAERETVLALIERSFISYNAIREVVSRHSTAVAGKPVHWRFSVARELGMAEIADPVTGAVTLEEEEPTEQENALISEAEAALVLWMDRVKAQKIFRQLVAGALLGKRAVLRLFVPPALRDEQGNVPSGDLSESLNRISLQCLNLDPDTLDQQAPPATVHMDRDSQREIGIFAYTAGEDDEERVELSYVDDDGNTVLRIVGEGVDEQVTMAMGGRLTLYEMTRDAMVTPQMVSQQKALNLSTTNRSHNDVMGAFLERLLFNVQLPGRFVDDPELAGGRRFVPEPFHVGPGTTNVLQGVVTEDEDGTRRVANPSVTYRNPVSPDTFIQSSDASYTNILREANQLHYATAGDAATSGESRRQAREAYVADLSVTADELEAACRWLLEAALAMASVFAGQAGRFEGLRAYAEAKMSSGPVGPEDLRAAADMWDRGVWSLERAMSATGVDDVDAEQQRIEQEQGGPAPTAAQLPAQPPAVEPVQTPRTVDDIAGLIAGGEGV